MLPYRGDRLRGNEIRRRVDAWVDAGVVEPTIADVVEEVLANPDWLRLEGTRSPCSARVPRWGRCRR